MSLSGKAWEQKMSHKNTNNRQRNAEQSKQCVNKCSWKNDKNMRWLSLYVGAKSPIQGQFEVVDI